MGIKQFIFFVLSCILVMFLSEYINLDFLNLFIPRQIFILIIYICLVLVYFFIRHIFNKKMSNKNV